jgi:hypothetical protein
MALSYGFFNAKLDSSSGEYDRTYDAEQFAEYFSLIVSNGVFPTPATQLQVVATSPTSMKVNVSAGYGWINGYYCKNDGDYPLTISAANGSLNRIDAIVLRWVNSSRSMELAVLTGTAAASPKTPTLTQTTEIYELMLATVTVSKGVTSISQSAITDKRSDSSVCGWVTGAVQNIDTTNLFAQYDASFQEWFSNIQSQLAGDVATNLQNQINQCVKLSDKATEDEAVAGTDDTKWMTPLKVIQAMADRPTKVELNRSTLVPIVSSYGATKSITTNIALKSTESDSFTLRQSIAFSVAGTGGYSKNLAFGISYSTQGNSNAFAAYFEVVMADGTTYTSGEFIPYNYSNTKIVMPSIVQLDLGTLNFTLNVYGRKTVTSSFTGGITITSITAYADKMGYIE